MVVVPQERIQCTTGFIADVTGTGYKMKHPEEPGRPHPPIDQICWDGKLLERGKSVTEGKVSGGGADTDLGTWFLSPSTLDKSHVLTWNMLLFPGSAIETSQQLGFS